MSKDSKIYQAQKEWNESKPHSKKWLVSSDRPKRGAVTMRGGQGGGKKIDAKPPKKK